MAGAGGDALSRALRELREAAGLRQVDAAERTGYSQPLIARFETGRQIPRPDQVEKLCDAYAATASARTTALEMARDARARIERVVMHRDAAPAQKRINRIAETARHERTFSPIGIPGLFQTAHYCQALFAGDPGLTPEAAAAGATARLDGQAILDTDRDFALLLPEGSLGWALAPAEAMATQMEHLIAASRRPNVRLDIIPWGQPVPQLPLNSWTQFDDRLVVVGTTTHVAYLTSRADIDAYARLYELLQNFAATGDDARAILTAAAARYRERQE